MKKLTFFTAMFIACTSFAQVPNYISTNGLVGWWPFNGNANDESGNGNNGTVNGATLTNDRNGLSNKAYSFIGNSLNYINIPHSSILNFQQSNKITISLWLKTNMTFPLSLDKVFMSKQFDNGSNQVGWNCSFSSNTTALLLKNGLSTTQGYVYANSSSIFDNNWHHLVYIFDNGNGYNYIDGNLVSTINGINSTIGDNTNSMTFGKPNWANDPNYTFTGNLDDISIFNRALTQQEITNLFSGVYNLPVELTQFSASCSENTTNINWQTATEHNSAYFEVLKSRDGENWNSLATVDAAGNSFEAINYSIKDDIDATTVYYKLNQVDKDGKSQEYGPISANCNENTSLFITPNPTNGEFNLIGMEHFGTITSLEVKDATGKVVKAMQPTTTQFTCNELKAGVYFLTVTSNKTEQIIKIIKE